MGEEKKRLKQKEPSMCQGRYHRAYIPYTKHAVGAQQSRRESQDNIRYHTMFCFIIGVHVIPAENAKIPGPGSGTAGVGREFWRFVLLTPSQNGNEPSGNPFSKPYFSELGSFLRVTVSEPVP